MTKQEAIRLAESGWWKDRSAEDIVSFQLFEEKLCMDFGDFHQAVEKALGRPVWTHEFAFIHKPGGLRDEFLKNAPQRTFEEVMNLIPPDKRIVISHE